MSKNRTVDQLSVNGWQTRELKYEELSQCPKKSSVRWWGCPSCHTQRCIWEMRVWLNCKQTTLVKEEGFMHCFCLNFDGPPLNLQISSLFQFHLSPFSSCETRTSSFIFWVNPLSASRAMAYLCVRLDISLLINIADECYEQQATEGFGSVW